MIEVIQQKFLEFINSIFKQYNIELYFKYSQEMDMIKSFRNDYRFIKDFNKNLIDDNITNKLFCIFSRTPLNKSDIFNNDKISLKVENNVNYNLRGVFNGSIDYSFLVLSGDYEKSEEFEIIYNYELVNSPKYFELTLQFDEDIEPIVLGYNLTFNQLSGMDLFEGTGKNYSFDVHMNGWFIVPYFEINQKIKYIDIAMYLEEDNKEIYNERIEVES